MVRKERAEPHDYIVPFSEADRRSSAIVERWLHDIRSRIPEGAVLSATVRAKGGFSAAFRLANEGEVISSEARGETVDEAVAKAGEGLCQHLPLLGTGEPDLHLAG